MARTVSGASSSACALHPGSGVATPRARSSVPIGPSRIVTAARICIRVPSRLGSCVPAWSTAFRRSCLFCSGDHACGETTKKNRLKAVLQTGFQAESRTQTRRHGGENRALTFLGFGLEARGSREELLAQGDVLE